MTYVPQSYGMSNIGNTSGDTGAVSNRLVFAGGNNITLSQATNASGSGTLTIIGGAGAGAFEAGISSNLGNTSGTTGTVGGQIVFAGGNNVTLSQSVNAGSATLTISAGAGGGGGGGTLSSYEPYPIHNTGTAVLSANTNTSGSATFIPFNVIEPVAARHINMLVSMNLTTGGTSSYNQSRTMSWGIYTRDTGANSTRMSVLTSNSLSYAMSYSNSSITISQATTTNDTGYAYSTTASAGLNISSQYTGLKRMQLLILTTLTPDDYYLGIFDRASSSSYNSGIVYSYYGNAISITGIAPMGSLSSAYSTGTNLVGGEGGNWLRNAGVFTSAGQTNLPNSLAISAMTNNLSVLPYMSFATTA